MTVVKYNNIVPDTIDTGRTRYLAATEDLMMTVIDFEQGPYANPDPPHSHPHQQVTYVAEGKVIFFLDGTPYQLEAGDLITVPPNVPHSIQLLSEHARLIDAFTPIRTDFLNSE